jgi:hypothetical protein
MARLIQSASPVPSVSDEKKESVILVIPELKKVGLCFS